MRGRVTVESWADLLPDPWLHGYPEPEGGVTVIETFGWIALITGATVAMAVVITQIVSIAKS